MAKITEFLKKIKSARRGLDVRDSIHDSIEAMNNQIENELGGMIENGNTVINNMQEEIQSVQDMKANGDLLMKPSDLTQEHWDKIKTDVTYYYKRYESTYTTVEENESNIPINISKYNEGSILEVYIEGRMLTREEYKINGTNSITLTTALSEVGTKVHFVVYRSVCAVNEDFDKLKGDTGEIGTPIPYDGTFNQLKSDDVDKLYNYIILDSSDTEYSGHWVYYDRNTSEWKDGGLYLSHQLTTEIKNELNEIITNISNVKEELEAENARLRKDLDALPSAQASGEYIHVEDSAESRFKSFKIGGNSKQETRQGYNLLDMRNALSYPDSGITCTVKEDGSYSYVGTATNDAINVWFRGGYYSEITEENTLFVLEAGTYYIKDVVLFSGTSKIDTINQIATLTKDMSITGIRAPSAKIGTTYNEIKYPIVAKSDVAVEWEQYGATPSLEFPSEVQAVGNNVNLFDKDNPNIIENAFINSTEMKIANVANRRCFYMPCKSNKSYTILRKKIGSIFVVGTTNELPTIDSAIIDVDYNGNEKTTINTSSNANYLVCYYKKTASEIDEDILNNIKIVEGTEIGEYSPYGQGSVNVTTQNENYFDKNKAYADGSGKQNVKLDKIQGLEVGENYTAYANGKGYLLVREYDKEENVIATYGGNTASNIIANFTKSSNDSRISIQFYSGENNVDVSSYDFTNVMIVKGTYTNASQLPAYVEHKSKTFTIPVQQEMLEGDYFDETEHHVWKKYVVTGNETFLYDKNNNVFGAYNLPIKVITEKANTSKCTHYAKFNEYAFYKNSFAIYSDFIRFHNDLNFTSADEFKSWLSEQYSNGAPVTIYYPVRNPIDLELTSEQKAVLNEIKKTAQSYKNITNIYSTDELSPVFEVEYRKKIESKTILSETVRKIVIVDDYPDVEEDGVLYLKKGTGSSSSGGGEMLTNLYYQDSDKEYTSSSSGYSCNWRTTKTVEINSNTYMTKDAQRSSNTFTLDLKENTTYKLVFNYVSGSGAKETETGKINYSLWNETTSTKLISQSTECGVSSEVTFTSTATETITAEMQMYLYTDVHYQDLIYEIGLYEVS